MRHDHPAAVAQRGRLAAVALSAVALLVCLGPLALREAGARPSTITPEITAVTLRRITYELAADPPSRLSEEQQVGNEEALTSTNIAARWGLLAGESILGRDDPQFRGRLGYRSEWQSDFHAEQDVEYWYGISYYLPSDWHQGYNERIFDDRIIFQFHEGTGGSPAFSLHLDEERERFVLRRRVAERKFDHMWSVPFEEEHWYDFAFQAKWTRDDDGFFRVYVDGRLLGSYEGPTLVDGSIIYTKWGVYGQPTRVLFDEVRIIEGRDALAIATPWRMTTVPRE